MRRNVDLIRELLLRLEEVGDDDPLRPYVVATAELCPDGYTTEQTDGHMMMLYDAGFIDHAEAAQSLHPGAWTVRGLTWAGHDFLDSVRHIETWTKTKEAAEAGKGWSFGLLSEIAKAVIKAEIAKRTGLHL